MPEIINDLIAVAFVMFSTIGIAVLLGWAIKRSGSSGEQCGKDGTKPKIKRRR
jgi:uncharacterized membrane protein AbrB (regulator of aidB expression)